MSRKRRKPPPPGKRAPRRTLSDGDREVVEGPDWEVVNDLLEYIKSAGRIHDEYQRMQDPRNEAAIRLHRHYGMTLYGVAQHYGVNTDPDSDRITLLLGMQRWDKAHPEGLPKWPSKAKEEVTE